MPVPSPLTSLAAAPSSAAPTASFRGFAALDDRVVQERGGILVVRAETVAIRMAHAEHLARRINASGLRAIVAPPARSPAARPAWAELAARLSITNLERDPSLAADQLASAAELHRAGLLLEMPTRGTWERAVLVELAHHRFLPLVVLFAPVTELATEVSAESFDVAATLRDDERVRWWQAIADAADGIGVGDRAADLESWWRGAQRPTPAAIVLKSLTREERRGLAFVERSGRSLRRANFEALGVAPDVVASLIESGHLREESGLVSLAPSMLSESFSGDAKAVLDADDVRALASELVRPTEAGARASDPWTHAHVADLWLEIGEVEAADTAHGLALARAGDTLVRREFVERWTLGIQNLDAATRTQLLVRAASRALEAGEADEAHRFAKRALGERPNDVDVVLLVGRAAVAMGDLVAAKVALERAEVALLGTQREAEVRAELAEIGYLTGDLDGARSAAAAALRSATTESVRLRARNTLGKALLAESAWAEADRHFAKDAHAASIAGELVAERRARLNRGIALLSSSRVEEARTLFQAVLEDGERAHDVRASAFALDNLAVVALKVHDYALALDLSERTLKLRLQLGDRLTTARIVTNLAELRRALGLLEHAEHTIAFGRRLLGSTMPAEWSAHFAVVAARIALDRSDNVAATKAIAIALESGESARNRQYLGEALRVSTRVALEDGDVVRAETHLDRARELASTDEARAEVAILAARIDRARGVSTRVAFDRAVALARTADHEELLAEGLCLLAGRARAEGEIDLARAHAAEALRVRERVAAGLPDAIRSAYFARRDVVAERHLVSILGAPTTSREQDDVQEDDRAPVTLRSRPPAAPSPAREMVGDDPSIRALLAAVRKVARSTSTVLIRGESGTGKELVAEALHRASDRAGGPLVTVNCAALVETLLLSELFGHEKGAFTGAVARRRGRFELAEGGTLFLDEIGDISPRTQVALLRVLQERTFERVGGAASVRANVRILCATHRDLKKMVERGEFREDLYYRLRGITLEVPALRNRLGDLPAIARSLLTRIAEERNERVRPLSADSLALLSRHKWPGNVRELENALRAASLFAEGDAIEPRHFMENVDELRAVAEAYAAERRSRASFAPPPSQSDREREGDGPSGESDSSLEDVGDDDDTFPLPAGEASATEVAYAQVRQGTLSLSDMKRSIERDCIARALAETKGNITRAAALLGMKRPRLSQLVKQYGLAAVSSEGS